jgi:hypothetical protein
MSGIGDAVTRLKAPAWLLCRGKTPQARRKKMSHSVKYTALLLGFLIAAGSVQPAIVNSDHFLCRPDVQ